MPSAVFFRLLIFIILNSILGAGGVWAEDMEPVARPDWGVHFEKAGVVGSIFVVDERRSPASAFVYNEERAAKAFSPASTFKIPHSLFALDAGVIKDEFEVMKWDGKKRSFSAWNADQNLRSSMRNSTVWVYERFAKALGDERELQYLEKIRYGNATVAGDSPFWLRGELGISARGQVEFLQRLYRNELPFKEAHQRLVKDLMIVEAGKNWILRAKTGWSGEIGWWVGWVELPSGPVMFALNIDMPRGIKDAPSREGVARAILQSLDVLPSKDSKVKE